jgi:serine phosphatase RsbU (regulator of sigma subunit)
VDDITDLRVLVNAWSSAVKGVGGDFYCIKRVNEDKFFASICDVSGKGIAASLVVSMVWGFLGAYNMMNGLKPMLVKLNASMVQTFHLVLPPAIRDFRGHTPQHDDMTFLFFRF